MKVHITLMNCQIFDKTNFPYTWKENSKTLIFGIDLSRYEANTKKPSTRQKRSQHTKKALKN